MNEEKPSPRKAGRPRNTAAKDMVLQVAYDIVIKDGVGRLTIERVANEAGVGKPTIYRYWANAHELAMAAFMAQPETKFRSPKGSGQQRLVTHIKSVIKTFSSRRGRQITLTMASAEQESELAKAFRNQVILKSRDTGRALLESALDDGTIRSKVDIETLLDMLYGPIFFRLLAGHQPLTTKLAEEIVETIFVGIGHTTP